VGGVAAGPAPCLIHATCWAGAPRWGGRLRCWLAGEGKRRRKEEKERGEGKRRRKEEKERGEGKRRRKEEKERGEPKTQ
jgi:hypothetical protein